MKLLIITGNLFPIPGNNANLMLKIAPFLSEQHEVRVLTSSLCSDTNALPPSICGLPLYVTGNTKVPVIKQRFFFPLKSKLHDPAGNSDLLNALYVREEMKRIRKEYPFDAVLASSEPYPAAVAASMQEGQKKILYLLDPPELLRNEAGTRFRNESLKKCLGSMDAVLTTPFISEALRSSGLGDMKGDVIHLGFPMIAKTVRDSCGEAEKGKIKLLFCGWMCSHIRSPRYFLDIVSRLDDRFEVTFMGRECEKLTERFPIETKATLVTLPNQPYETALEAMADADILINIGNSVPVHMPSKTLEYINTGKPMVNFYKLEDCPTLYYTKRYPLALNLSEGDADMDQAAGTFIRFCEENKGKTVDRDLILREYADCTPEYIAQKILNCLEN